MEYNQIVKELQEFCWKKGYPLKGVRANPLGQVRLDFNLQVLDDENNRKWFERIRRDKHEKELAERNRWK